MTLRTATAADAERLSPLFAQLGYPADVEVIASRLRSLDSHTIVMVAEKDSSVQGFVAVGFYPEFIVEEAVVFGLVVDEPARNQGVGAQLLRAAETWAWNAGARTMIVRSNVVRGDAHRFYEREGYQRKKTQHIFEKRR